MFLAVTKARGLGRGRKARRLQFIDKGSSQVSRPDLLGAVVYFTRQSFRELLASCGQPTVSLVAFIQFYPRNRDARNTQALRLRLEQSPSRHGGDYVFRRRQRMRCLTEGSGAFKTRGLRPRLLHSTGDAGFL